MNRRTRVLALICAGAALLAAASSAQAAGGASIATAPAVAYGQQQFATGVQGGQFCGTYVSWWAMPVTAGDRLTVDYQLQVAGGEDYFTGVFVYQAGTTDFNATTSHIVQEGGPDAFDGLTGELKLTAAQSGSMPLEFYSTQGCGAVPGTGVFTVNVQHSLTASLSSPHQDRAHHKTYFWVRAYDGNGHGAPLGLNVGVQGRDSHGHWIWWNWKAWKAYNFWIGWPRNMRGKWWTVRTVVSGRNWQTVYSRPIRVKGV